MRFHVPCSLCVASLLAFAAVPNSLADPPSPALSRIGSLDQLRRVQSKSGGLRVNVNRANKKITDPNPAGYFHSLSSQSATVYGADAWLNLWDPAVDIPSSPGDDHSISQLWLQNYQKPQLQSLAPGRVRVVADVDPLRAADELGDVAASPGQRLRAPR